jgi:2-polyprenyl-6-methoxyphenol hydroxylase-like FAD-dependent oxidoreductase
MHIYHWHDQLLRELLMDALEPGTISWGQKFYSYETEPNGFVKASFISTQDNEKDESFKKQTMKKDDEMHHLNSVYGDVLVGCDGIWSNVRKQKLKLDNEIGNVRYLGVMVILGRGRVSHELTSTDPDK